MTGCSAHRDDLDAYIDRELTADASQRFQTHLGECALCREAIDARALLDAELRSLPRVEASPQFEAQFWARLARSHEPALPWWRRMRWVPLALGASAAGALAIMLFTGNPSRPPGDLEILANAEDFELLLDDDHELVMALDVLEAWDGAEES